MNQDNKVLIENHSNCPVFLEEGIKLGFLELVQVLNIAEVSKVLHLKTDWLNEIPMKTATGPGTKSVELQRLQQILNQLFSMRSKVDNLVKKMLRNGIIEHSMSLWASPIVLVAKQDGSTHFCVDLCCLNAIKKLDEFPLLQVDDSLDVLSGIKYFPPWTWPLDIGRLACLQTLKRRQREVSLTIVYLDDILVMREYFQEHLNMKEVFGRVCLAGLKSATW